jgi:hypothetical protein
MRIVSCRHAIVHSFVIVAVLAAGACSSSDDGANDPVTGAGGGHGPVGGTSVPPTGTTPTPEAPPPPPEPPLFVGRFDTRDPAAPKASWPGTRVLARFEGTTVSVKMSEYAADWMDGAPSYWQVRIDKGNWTPLAMIADNTPHDFVLADGLPPGPHEVEIYKRSETQTGVTQFLGFDFHGGKSLPSPPRQPHKIEVMGDSFATGFGDENIDSPDTDCPGPDWAGKWENFGKSWGALLGEMFDAEVHGIVYSGKGLLSNVWPTDNDPLRDYYNRSDPNPEIAYDPPLFDLTSWIPDVIVMTQGSCDSDTAEWRAAYKEFIVNVLRKRGPETHIFMGIVSAGMRDSVTSIANEIIAERAPLGDHRLYAFLAKPFTWEEVTACNGHGTPAWHQRVAGEIGALIHDKVGW